jgi:hypothetical protein
MENTNKNTAKPAASAGPWRSGRPSRKAFYPYWFLVAIVWIAFIVLGARCSCDALKSKKAVLKEEQPVAETSSVSCDFALLTSRAYAQDASIDELPAAEEPAAEETVVEEPAAEEAAVEEPVAEEAVVEEPAAGEAAVEESVAEESVAEESVAEESVAEESVAEESVAEEAVAEEAVVEEPAAATPAAPQKSVWYKFSTWSLKYQLTTIWALCLTIPILLTCWVLFKMICKIYGIRYEIRTDEDNPNATSFLITRGILNKSTDTMHIGDIKDIKSEQSFVQKYFKGGVGTIVLYTKDLTDGVVRMEDMDDPSRVLNAFDSLRRRFWSRGGMQLGSGTANVDGDLSGVEEIPNDFDIS